MTTRTLMTGILGGIAMFIWTSIAHMFTPLGETGVRELPNEAAVLSALSPISGKTGASIFTRVRAPDPIQRAPRRKRP